MDRWQRRKIKYRLADEPNFDPYQSDEERRKEEADAAERDGWFHTWTQVSEEDVKSGQILISAYGVIETLEGKIIDLPRHWFRFLEP